MFRSKIVNTRKLRDLFNDIDTFETYIAATNVQDINTLDDIKLNKAIKHIHIASLADISPTDKALLINAKNELAAILQARQFPKEHNADKIKFANLNLSCAKLDGIKLKKRSALSYLNLSHAECIKASFDKSYLHASNLSMANMSNSSFVKTSLVCCQSVETNFSYANLSNADCGHANFQKSNFTHATLNDTNFGLSNLGSANFERANLYKARFVLANLNFAIFTGAYLYGAKFRGANLSYANLVNADLRKTDFTGAVLAGAVIIQENLVLDTQALTEKLNEFADLLRDHPNAPELKALILSNLDDQLGRMDAAVAHGEINQREPSAEKDAVTRLIYRHPLFSVQNQHLRLMNSTSALFYRSESDLIESKEQKQLKRHFSVE